jgi:hypothetical protein
MRPRQRIQVLQWRTSRQQGESDQNGKRQQTSLLHDRLLRLEVCGKQQKQWEAPDRSCRFQATMFMVTIPERLPGDL